MSDISVSDADTFTILTELLSRKDAEGDEIFSLQTLSWDDKNVLLVTAISVKKPMYLELNKKEQEPIPGSQVPPIQTPSNEEE